MNKVYCTEERLDAFKHLLNDFIKNNPHFKSSDQIISEIYTDIKNVTMHIGYNNIDIVHKLFLNEFHELASEITIDKFKSFFNDSDLCNNLQEFNKLDDEKWQLVEQFFVEDNINDKSYKKRYSDRSLLDGILWVILNKKSWKDIPCKYPSYPTCNRHYSLWKNNGILQQVLKTLQPFWEEIGVWSLAQSIIDGTYVPQKGGRKKKK